MIVPDRLSLRTVRLDYVRSLRRFRDPSKRDWHAIAVLFLLPVVLAAVVLRLNVVLTAPTAILPAVALLAGILLAAAGQIITMRARIADSLTLSSDKRITGMVRETISGVLLAAVAALVDALLLGVLASLTPPGFDSRWWHEVLSAVIMGVTAFMSLMFVVTARRLYATYLEVFENGNPLPKHPSKVVKSTPAIGDDVELYDWSRHDQDH